MEEYLASSEIIDWRDPSVLCQAQELAQRIGDKTEIAKRCFEWLREEIRHCLDHKLDLQTGKASEVLEAKAGWCTAKSHLLAALLRANGIPAGLCYQRFRRDEENGGGYGSHGLNAIDLEEYGWYRVDPRGNRGNVNAKFTPPDENLAFPAELDGEMIHPKVWAEPLEATVEYLRIPQTWQEFRAPDLDIFQDL